MKEQKPLTADKCNRWFLVYCQNFLVFKFINWDFTIESGFG